MIKDLIRERRISKGLTMKELGDKIGVSEATISRWESGEIANMRREGIMRLSNILDIPPSTILGIEESVPIVYHDLAKQMSEEKIDPKDVELFIQMMKSKGK